MPAVIFASKAILKHYLYNKQYVNTYQQW